MASVWRVGPWTCEHRARLLMVIWNANRTALLTGGNVQVSGIRLLMIVRILHRRFYSPRAPPEPPPADQHGRASRHDPGLPPSAMRPRAPDSGVVRTTAGGGRNPGPRRNGPRSGTEKATDGAGASGYADHPTRLCSSDLAFQGASCCRHRSLHRVRTRARCPRRRERR